MLTRQCLVLAALPFVVPLPAWAQGTPAGVVTRLQGTVTAARAASPQPVVLKFKDGVFVNDRIVTGDQSIVRMLLGGKAVVTVRERSSLTITEVPGRSTVNLESGKIALAVARERMRPGESVEIRTPSAVAGIRGTVVIAEHKERRGNPGGVTTFFGLTGTFEAIFGAQSFLVGPGQFATGDAAGGRAGTTTAEMLADALNGLQMPAAEALNGGQEAAKEQALGVTMATFGTRTDGTGAEQLALVQAGGVQALAGRLIDDLTSSLVIQNPLQPPILPGAGGVLDPAVLLGDGSGRSRDHGRGCPPGLAKQGRC